MVASTKKSPTKKGRFSVRDQHSPSKDIKAQMSPSKEPVYSHLPPSERQKKANGRVSGRKLIIWNRPRMAEKLLLHMYYECQRFKMNIPWDAIAHRLHPGSSGTAVVQHLNRLRRDLVSEGHLVPPMPQKPGTNTNADPRIRGYIRSDPNGDDRETTRPVFFDEHVPDAKFNLPDGFDSRYPEVEECGNSVEPPEEEEEPAIASPSPSRPPLFVTPKRMRRSSSVTSSHHTGDGSINMNGPSSSQSLDAVDEGSEYNRSSYSTPQNGRSYEYMPEMNAISRSFDYTCPPRPSFERSGLQPENPGISWQDNHGVYFWPHPANTMPTGGAHPGAFAMAHPRLQPRMLASPWGFPFPSMDGQHPGAFGMPATPYTISDQGPTTPVTPPHPVPKVESPEKALFSDDAQKIVDTEYMPTSAIKDCELDSAM